MCLFQLLTCDDLMLFVDIHDGISFEFGLLMFEDVTLSCGILTGTLKQSISKISRLIDKENMN